MDSTPTLADTSPQGRRGMFPGMIDKDEEARQHLNDWLSGSGAIVAAVIAAILLLGILWQLVKELF